MAGRSKSRSQPPQFDEVGKQASRRVKTPLQVQREPALQRIAGDAVSLRNWEEPDSEFRNQSKARAIVDCGWGRVIFGHTFANPEAVARALSEEREGARDLALYLRDPHLVLAAAPHELFLDPSHTYRLRLDTLKGDAVPSDVRIRRARWKKDAAAMRRLFMARHMVPVPEEKVLASVDSDTIFFLVAEQRSNRRIIGTVTGIDHQGAFRDPEQGSSLWTLAVDPQAQIPGIGQALVTHLAHHFAQRGRAFMDLSVLAENTGAIRLYEKLGFNRVPVFCVKRRHNPINEPLYTPAHSDETFNPYARIIIDVARRRGIGIEAIDPGQGYFALTYGGRRIVCRESLSELTTAVAMSRCADKTVTSRLWRQAGLKVPAQQMTGNQADNYNFLKRHQRVVVKPVDGEQGQGISVDVRSREALDQAITQARAIDARVILEEFVSGDDLRILVINGEVVAAALRRPASIIGDGTSDCRTLIEKQSRRRAAATGGESTIPLDGDTLACLKAAGLDWQAVPAAGREVAVRRTANLHTGGTIHDCTDRLSHRLAKVAIRAAEILAIPVVGLDMMVADPSRSDYRLIEANERPGLANHEPQPTAERFVDLLFPHTTAGAPP